MRFAGSPHTRGDGPRLVCPVWAWFPFSPHAWGWSDPPRCGISGCEVLPTRVGMVRFPANTVNLSAGSPHTRGDGPYSAEDIQGMLRFSPHAWGWSGHLAHHPPLQQVLPTRVGMVRLLLALARQLVCSPHTRGDGPHSSFIRCSQEQFSPHAWGWSGRRPRRPSLARVLPTRVGMVRFS